MSSSIQILAFDETPLGVLCLRRRELLSRPGTFVTEITLNHEFLMSSYHTDSERALSRIGIEMHGGTDLDVMVGGLGLGYTAKAALDTGQVQSLEVVEILPQVIAWLQDGLVPLSEELNKDDRFDAGEGDAYQRLAGPPATRHDLILIDIDHSPDDRLGTVDASFYSEAGLRSAHQHLQEGGVLGVWSYEESDSLTAAMNQVFDEVQVEPVRHENELIDQVQTDWLYFGKRRSINS